MRCAAALALLLALCGCREKLRTATLAGVEAALPAWPEEVRHEDAGSGSVMVGDGHGSSVALAWDVDPRTAPLTADVARRIAGLAGGDAAPMRVAGHDAILVRGAGGSAVVWRCDATRRLFHLVTSGPRSPEIANLAAHTLCHAERIVANGDMPAPSVSALGAGWQFASRARGSISWTRGDEVLTFFAGQTTPAPPDSRDAQAEAPAWVAAAGLSDAQPQQAEPARGPEDHPALRVRGTARLDGQPVRWTLLFWRCVPRQRSYAAVVFSAASPDESALLAARCHA